MGLLAMRLSRGGEQNYCQDSRSMKSCWTWQSLWVFPNRIGRNVDDGRSSVGMSAAHQNYIRTTHRMDLISHCKKRGMHHGIYRKGQA
eukprot:267494-Amphidinium_carterae.1